MRRMPWSSIETLEKSELSWFDPTAEEDMDMEEGEGEGEGEQPIQSLRPLGSHQRPEENQARSHKPRDTPPENPRKLIDQGEGSTESQNLSEDGEGHHQPGDTPQENQEKDMQEGGRTAGSEDIEDIDMDGGGRPQGPNRHPFPKPTQTRPRDPAGSEDVDMDGGGRSRGPNSHPSPKPTQNRLRDPAGSEDVDMDGGGRSQSPNRHPSAETTRTPPQAHHHLLRSTSRVKRKQHPTPTRHQTTKPKKKKAQGAQDMTAGSSNETAIDVDESLVGKFSPPLPLFL